MCHFQREAFKSLYANSHHAALPASPTIGARVEREPQAAWVPDNYDERILDAYLLWIFKHRARNPHVLWHATEMWGCLLPQHNLVVNLSGSSRPSLLLSLPSHLLALPHSLSKLAPCIMEKMEATGANSLNLVFSHQGTLLFPSPPALSVEVSPPHPWVWCPQCLPAPCPDSSYPFILRDIAPLLFPHLSQSAHFSQHLSFHFLPS